MQKIIDYVNMNRIFIPSVMHSGTIFTRNLLAYAGYKYFIIYLWQKDSGVKIVDSVKENKVYYVDNIIDLGKLIRTGHFNFNIGDENGNSGIGVIHAHITQSREGFISDNFTIALMNVFKTVIPMRDPLLAMGTRYKRALNKDEIDTTNCNDIIEGICLFAKYYNKDIHFILPIDLYEKQSKEDRIKVLEGLFKYAGIMPSREYVANAGKWERKNVLLLHYKINNNKPAELQRFLDSGNLEKIKEIMGEDYEYLKSKESVIRPFLESIGYKNLLWWD